MTNEQKKQMYADNVTARSKMIAALEAIQHTNAGESKLIGFEIKALRSRLEDAAEMFEAYCQKPF